jgi:hypothetical protein
MDDANTELEIMCKEVVVVVAQCEEVYCNLTGVIDEHLSRDSWCSGRD